jgi:hypothetical protein
MPVDREEVLDAIRRCAERAGGQPPGRTRFERETGIRESDWLGRHWARWSDAVIEAGFQPNAMQEPRPETDLLGALAALTRELRHFPTDAERRLRRRQDPTFPSWNSYRRFGRNADVAAALVDWCDEHAGWDDVRAICEPLVVPSAGADSVEPSTSEVVGVVYLMRSGRHYKIGRSNSAGRRAYELAIQLPERLELVHAIETDDPEGIEAYWHRRFADRRANGEWFSLSKADVAAFRRRRRYM